MEHIYDFHYFGDSLSSENLKKVESSDLAFSEYPWVEFRDNGMTLDGDFSFQELRKLVKLINSFKNPEDKIATKTEIL